MVAVVLSMLKETMSYIIHLLRVYFERVPQTELLNSIKAVWI